MTTARMIKHIYSSKATIEGAGVRLNRAFGYNEVPTFDPFLMLDDFGSANPKDYIAGFPWRKKIEIIFSCSLDFFKSSECVNPSHVLILPGDISSRE